MTERDTSTHYSGDDRTSPPTETPTGGPVDPESARQAQAAGKELPLVDDTLAGYTATEQLATMLSDHQEISARVDESTDEIELVSETGEARMNWPVVISALTICLGIVVWGLAAPKQFGDFASSALGMIVDNFGWAFILFSTIFVFFIAILALSKFGQIRLGRDDEAPEFRTVSWIAMMFAAGMGIGLMFYGASEPLTFYREGVPLHHKHEVGAAMSSAMFHWTLHPWAVYGIVALAIAYSTFRLGRPQLVSAAFIPLIGKKRAEGFLGKLIDMLAIIATVFGTACSLGVGAVQIGAGLKASGLIANPGQSTIIGIVSVLTLAFILSALSGVGRGVQYLSNANMVLAALLAIFVFIVGPTVSILNLIPGSVGTYISNFFEMAGRTAMSADGTAGDWLSSWTIFYWAWWISWSPFVGMFLARISRGRTIREFAAGVMLVPTGVSVVWFSIFGGTAITLEQEGHSIYGDGSAEQQLFDLLHALPLGTITGVIAMVLLATFFITSADSASTVMGSMSQYGRTEATPMVSAMWGVLTALIGLTMLLSAGDDTLGNLQNVTIIAASPFLLVVILLMFALVKDLRNDVLYLDYRSQQEFAARLARERRIHAENMRRKALKERRLQRAQNRKRHTAATSARGSR